VQVWTGISGWLGLKAAGKDRPEEKSIELGRGEKGELRIRRKKRQTVSKPCEDEKPVGQGGEKKSVKKLLINKSSGVGHCHQKRHPQLIKVLT